MNDVDDAEQMRLFYRFDVWIRNRKWWWSLFLWELQVLMNNTWIWYKIYQKERNIKLSFNHYIFIRSIYLEWIDEDGHWPDWYMNGSERSASLVPHKGMSNRESVPFASRVYYDSLLPERALKRRLNSDLSHLAEPLPSWLKDLSCQIHIFTMLS